MKLFFCRTEYVKETTYFFCGTYLVVFPNPPLLAGKWIGEGGLIKREGTNLNCPWKKLQLWAEWRTREVIITAAEEGEESQTV